MKNLAALCLILSASLPTISCAQSSAPPPPKYGPPPEDFRPRYYGFVVDEVLTRDVFSDVDRNLWQGHFDFVRANTRGPWNFQILCSGIGAMQAGGVHLLLVVRVTEPEGRDVGKVNVLIAKDPAVAAGLIKLVSLHPFDLDEPFR